PLLLPRLLLRHRTPHPRSSPLFPYTTLFRSRGLGARWMGLLFAVVITLTYGFVFNSVQSNSIVDALGGSLGVDIAAAEALWFRILVGAVLVGLTAAIIFGGIRRISAVSEIVVPIMAVLYLL